MKEIIEKCMGSGLWSADDQSYFTWQGCDYCSPSLGATVTDCKGFVSLKDAQTDPENYYEFRLCDECLNKLVNGEN